MTEHETDVLPESYMEKYKKAYKKTHRQINITVTKSQYKDFEKLATKKGKKVAHLVRELALESLHPDTGSMLLVPEVNAETAEELRRLLRNMANNMNQIAHQMNLNSKLYGTQINMSPEDVMTDLYTKIQGIEQTISQHLTGRPS